MTQTNVDAFMMKLNHPLKQEIEALRAIILASDSRVAESIKWNAPSFYVTDHFATVKLRPEKTVQIVFHTGAKGRADLSRVAIGDPAGLLTWAAANRALATFYGMDDIETKKGALTILVREWLKQVE